MIRKEHLKFKEIVGKTGEGLNLTQSLLYSIAFGEDISSVLKNNSKAQQSFYGMRRYRFIRKTIKEKYELTPKGEKKLHTIFINEIVIKNPSRWDGKWRLAMYDLPIRFSKARNALRFKLKDLGFFQLQKSAWIYPYPCEGEILLVADFFGVRKYIQILEVTKILNDRKARKYFNL